MTVTYKPGDRVVINWDKIDNNPYTLKKFELERFEYGETYTGTVENIEFGTAIIIWDKPYHSDMYGRYGKQWNLIMEVLKLAKELTSEEKILRRIKITYAKSNLPFVQNWSN